jgi:hypothetical protein
MPSWAHSPWIPARPTVVFDTYWRFAAERQAIFLRRLKGASPPWTGDPILRQYKFTNAYRLLDRVSQYLLRNVIYRGDQEPEEVFFRTILFKLFNRIETWELLQEAIDGISWRKYSYRQYNDVVGRALQSGRKIYSGAYIMPSGKSSFGYARKHSNHLRLLERMMKDGLPSKMVRARNMREGFELLREYPLMGDFLAYQFITDLNYSEIINFSEMEFVIPGPGAKDGLRKCFESFGGLNEVEIIKRVAELQSSEFQRLGLQFYHLWGRPLQLIDCQNLFCEVDKYARIAHPNYRGRSNRSRIKQKFRPNLEPIDYWFPPKWGINKAVRCVHSTATQAGQGNLFKAT